MSIQKVQDVSVDRPGFQEAVSLQVAQRVGAASQQNERPPHLCFLFPQQLKLRPLPNMQGRLWHSWFSVPSPRLAGSGNLKKNSLHCKTCLNRSWSHPWPTTGVPGSSTTILSPGFSSCWLYVRTEDSLLQSLSSLHSLKVMALLL